MLPIKDMFCAPRGITRIESCHTQNMLLDGIARTYLTLRVDVSEDNLILDSWLNSSHLDNFSGSESNNIFEPF